MGGIKTTYLQCLAILNIVNAYTIVNADIFVTFPAFSDRSKALAEKFTSLSKLQKLKLSFSSNSNDSYAHIHPPGHGLLSLAEICGSIAGRLKVLRLTFEACYLPKLYLEV